VSVLGEVKNESTIQANDNTLTLLQALASAGGADEFGDLSKIKIIRQSGDKTFVFYANLLTEDYLKSPYFYLEPNDVVVVPPLKQRSFLKYMSPNISLLATTVSLVISILALLSIK
jgi:polysaccharide export outer membrane protein